MRRERSGLRPVHLVLAVLLLVPPGVRIGLHLGRTEPETDALADKTLQNERDAAVDQLQQIADEWRLPTIDDPEKRYSVVPADVVPLSDPSARRSLLWAITRGIQTVPVDTAATAGGLLVGRVVRPFDSLRVVKIQTLLDPEFRVRFRHKNITGLLQGTGREHNGHPVLEVKYVTGMADLSDGDPVLTEGNDGLYPPSVLIGRIASASDCGGLPVESRLVVRAAVRLDELARLRLAVDTGRLHVLQARAPDSREEPVQ